MKDSFLHDRLKSIDALRGFGVVLVILSHSSQYWTNNPNSIFLYALNSFAIFAAPIFFILAGMSLILMKDRRKLEGQSESKIKKHVIKRGIFLILFGYAYNLIVESAIFYLSPNFSFQNSSTLFPIYTNKSFLDWISLFGIFQAIGLCYLITYFLIRFSRKTRISIVVFILILNIIVTYSPLMFGMPPFRAMQLNWHYSPTADPIICLLDIFFYGQFPVVPWLAFFIMGTITCEILIEHFKNDKLTQLSKKTWKTSCIFSFAGAFELILFIFPGFFPDSTLYVIFTISIVLILHNTFFVFYYIDKKSSWIYDKILIPMGQFSLTLYLITGLIFVDLFLVIGNVINFQLLGNLPDLIVIPLSISQLFLFVLITISWKKINFKYSLTWIEKKLTN
ncbi:MAG: heparan-alpha-glucosaminide N-acetyltransferase domain-containing protein [Promethearchaeota archaeon]